MMGKGRARHLPSPLDIVDAIAVRSCADQQPKDLKPIALPESAELLDAFFHYVNYVNSSIIEIMRDASSKSGLFSGSPFVRSLDRFAQMFHIYGEMNKAAAINALGALAQETRIDIFKILAHAGPEGLPAGTVGARLGLPSPTLSFHLNQLRFAGLVTSRRKSRSIIYTANFKTMNELLAYLTEDCCGGRPELCAPNSFVPVETLQSSARAAASRTGRARTR
jgi:DNA-binding transcriptional ArsR family regulator